MAVVAAVIHGSFKTGIEVTDWNIKTAAKGVFQILHDLPVEGLITSV